MIQFHLSKDAAKDLKELLDPPEPMNYQAMQWYLHRVTVARRKCIVAMERTTRYTIVFCGLTKKDFAAFPQLFCYWFSLHVLACVSEQLGQDEAREQHVIEVAADLASGQSYQVGFDRSVTAHIKQVVELLRYYVEQRNYPLPVEPRDTALFLMRANDELRKTQDAPDYFLPTVEFSNIWLELFGMKQISRSQPIVSSMVAFDKPPSNVINVDFANRRKS